MRCALVGGADHQVEVALRQHWLGIRDALPKDLSQSLEDVEANGISRTGSARDSL